MHSSIIPTKTNLEQEQKLPFLSTIINRTPTTNMKQKIVYKVQAKDNKGKSALTVAAAQAGVSSVKIGGDGKDKLVVIGDEVDIVALAKDLEKKVGHTRIVSVKVLNDNNNDENDEENRFALTTTYHPGRSTDYYYPNSYGQYHQPYPY